MNEHHTSHQPHDHGTHGMLLFGENTLYLSHLPMFMSMHDHQVIMEVTLSAENEDAHALYRADRQDSGERVYTLVPERFSLMRIGAEGDDALRTFQGTVHSGHFEKPGNRVILSDVTVNVVNVIHFRRFDPQAESLPQLAYLLFGRNDELYLAHLITKAPDFDQIVPVKSISHDFSAETLRRGVSLTFPGRGNQSDDRLRDGDQAAAQVELVLETKRELYFEEGELAKKPTFDTTSAEEAAGFG